jgi:hypothetical protein
MKPTYETVTDSFGLESIKRTDADGSIWWIPVDPANSDYQRYLENEAKAK